MISSVSRSAVALVRSGLVSRVGRQAMANVATKGALAVAPVQEQLINNMARTAPVRALATDVKSNAQSIASLVIQAEQTPNPESVKFIPGYPVLEGLDESGAESGSGFFVNRTDAEDEIARSPLAESLFDIKGVKAVYLGDDFVTVTKEPDFEWDHVRTPVFDALKAFHSSDKPALTDTTDVTDTTVLEDDSESVLLIKELLETRIRPAVQGDGGDIRFVDFDEASGIVKVRLAGSCVGCPSSTMTLKNGVERMLMHYLDEVRGVVALEEGETESTLLFTDKV